jgi:hypothetical protein
MVQKDRQEENSFKAIKEKKKNTQQTKSNFINGIQNQKCTKSKQNQNSKSTLSETILAKDKLELWDLLASHCKIKEELNHIKYHVRASSFLKIVMHEMLL